MKGIYSMLFVLLCSQLVFAQFNSEIVTQWESTFQNYGTVTNVIGMSVAIRSADDLWVGQYGISGETDPLNEDHLFGMGSVSKTITSATILRMYEENLLTLDDPLHFYLDSFENVDSTVIIRQLLNHTSGIYNYTNNPGLTAAFLLNPAEIVSPESVVNDYVLAPAFAQGTAFGYSNTNYLLLGMIIQEISGQTYYEEARARFDFDSNYPSFVLPPYEISTDDLAHLWVALDGVNVIDAQAAGFSLNALFSGAGAAGAYAAAPKDLTQWLRDLYTGQILQPATMDELLMGSTFNANYGLGVVLIDGFCNTSLSGHAGGIIYTTASYYDSVNDIAISVHTNDGQTVTDMNLLALSLFCDYDEFVTSVSELDEGVGEIAVFPNPFEESATLSIELTNAKTISYQIVDEMGRNIYQSPQLRKGAGLHALEVNRDLSSGIYLIHILVGEVSFYRKLIKQ